MIKKEKDILIETLKRYEMFGMRYLDQIVIFNNQFDSKHLPSSNESLFEYTKNCQLCKLSINKDRFSFGAGNSDGDVYVVSKDISIYNDSNSKMVIDTILNDILEIDQNDIYFTSLLKCTPLNSFEHLNDEINLCKNYLFKQIEIKKPRVIVTLGDTLDHFTGTKNNILELSGNIYNYNNIKVLPIENPSFLAKNPSVKQKVFDKLIKLKDNLDKK